MRVVSGAATGFRSASLVITSELLVGECRRRANYRMGFPWKSLHLQSRACWLPLPGMSASRPFHCLLLRCLRLLLQTALLLCCTRRGDFCSKPLFSSLCHLLAKEEFDGNGEPLLIGCGSLDVYLHLARVSVQGEGLSGAGGFSSVMR